MARVESTPPASLHPHIDNFAALAATLVKTPIDLVGRGLEPGEKYTGFGDAARHRGAKVIGTLANLDTIVRTRSANLLEKMAKAVRTDD